MSSKRVSARKQRPEKGSFVGGRRSRPPCPELPQAVEDKITAEDTADGGRGLRCSQEEAASAETTSPTHSSGQSYLYLGSSVVVTASTRE